MNKSAPAAHNTEEDTRSPAAVLKELWLGTCARFTVLCLILLVTSSIAEDSLTVTYVDTVRFFLLLPFGLCLTLSAWVRRSDKLSAGAKVGLHALSTLGSFYLFCYLPYQVRTSPSGMQVLIILMLVAILYAAVMAIWAGVTRKSRQRKLDETPYESQFRKE
jgi:hypothetical protein